MGCGSIGLLQARFFFFNFYLFYLLRANVLQILPLKTEREAGPCFRFPLSYDVWVYNIYRVIRKVMYKIKPGFGDPESGKVAYLR